MPMLIFTVFHRAFKSAAVSRFGCSESSLACCAIRMGASSQCSSLNSLKCSSFCKQRAFQSEASKRKYHLQRLHRPSTAPSNRQFISADAQLRSWLPITDYNTSQAILGHLVWPSPSCDLQRSSFSRTAHSSISTRCLCSKPGQTSKEKVAAAKELSEPPSESSESAAESAEPVPPRLAPFLPKDALEARQRFDKLVESWRFRAASFARESTLLIYSALIDNTLVVVLEKLKVDQLLRKLQPVLEQTVATVFGAYRELKDGRRIPISLVNNTSPYFGVPEGTYQPWELKLGLDLSRYDPAVAHLMSLAMKVVYEEPEVVQDIVERDWRMQYHGYFSTQTEAISLYDLEHDHTADFIPRTRACVISSQHGLIIAFRGSEPLNLINLRSSGKITMSERLDMGRIHDGFYAGLFHSDPEKGSLYAQIVDTLQGLDLPSTTPILLAGHSLGGALSMVFAAALTREHTELANRVAAIYTFGMPRVGDAEFGQHMEECYPDKCFRMTHAADIIPLLPPRFLQYAHFGQEHYITSTGRLVEGSVQIGKARRVETFGFIPLYFYKLLGNLLLNPREGVLRTIYRLVMLVTFPGLSDHFPSDYQYKLGCLLQEDAKQRPQT